MISLILPYWDRQAAANKAIALLDQHYQDLDLEVIVVDDGNAVPFVAPQTSLDLRVVRLPEKPFPTPQSKAWNAGVAAARGDVIALSCVEVLHETPVLAEMWRRLAGTHAMTCVLAAAWCPERNEWHCHSTHHVEFCPPGTGPTFLSMMYRSIFHLAGGFDEDYHHGAGYEDKDFIMRLVKAGVKFSIQDDLVVLHPKTGARIRWPITGFARNLSMFRRKWALC